MDDGRRRVGVLPGAARMVSYYPGRGCRGDATPGRQLVMVGLQACLGSTGQTVPARPQALEAFAAAGGYTLSSVVQQKDRSLAWAIADLIEAAERDGADVVGVATLAELGRTRREQLLMHTVLADLLMVPVLIAQGDGAW